MGEERIVKVKLLRKCFIRTHPRAPAERQCKAGRIIQIIPSAFSSRFMRVMNPDDIDVCKEAIKAREAHYKKRREEPQDVQPYGLGEETDDIGFDGSDLSLIDGIGPRLRESLEEIEIKTIQQFVDMEDDLLVDIDGISPMNLGPMKDHAIRLLDGLDADNE